MEAVEKHLGGSAKLLFLDEPVAQAPLEVEVVAFWELELHLVAVCSATMLHSQQ